MTDNEHGRKPLTDNERDMIHQLFRSARDATARFIMNTYADATDEKKAAVCSVMVDALLCSAATLVPAAPHELLARLAVTCLAYGEAFEDSEVGPDDVTSGIAELLIDSARRLNIPDCSCSACRTERDRGEN